MATELTANAPPGGNKSSVTVIIGDYPGKSLGIGSISSPDLHWWPRQPTLTR